MWDDSFAAECRAQLARLRCVLPWAVTVFDRFAASPCCGVNELQFFNARQLPVLAGELERLHDEWAPFAALTADLRRFVPLDALFARLSLPHPAGYAGERPLDSRVWGLAATACPPDDPRRLFCIAQALARPPMVTTPGDNALEVPGVGTVLVESLGVEVRARIACLGCLAETLEWRGERTRALRVVLNDLLAVAAPAPADPELVEQRLEWVAGLYSDPAVGRVTADGVRQLVVGLLRGEGQFRAAAALGGAAPAGGDAVGGGSAPRGAWVQLLAREVGMQLRAGRPFEAVAAVEDRLGPACRPGVADIVRRVLREAAPDDAALLFAEWGAALNTTARGPDAAELLLDYLDQSDAAAGVHPNNRLAVLEALAGTGLYGGLDPAAALQMLMPAVGLPPGSPGTVVRFADVRSAVIRALGPPVHPDTAARAACTLTALAERCGQPNIGLAVLEAFDRTNWFAPAGDDAGLPSRQHRVELATAWLRLIGRATRPAPPSATRTQARDDSLRTCHRLAESVRDWFGRPELVGPDRVALAAAVAEARLELLRTLQSWAAADPDVRADCVEAALRLDAELGQQLLAERVRVRAGAALPPDLSAVRHDGVRNEHLAATLLPGEILVRAGFAADGTLLWAAWEAAGGTLRRTLLRVGRPGDRDRLQAAVAEYEFRLAAVAWLAGDPGGRRRLLAGSVGPFLGPPSAGPEASDLVERLGELGVPRLAEAARTVSRYAPDGLSRLLGEITSDAAAPDAAALDRATDAFLAAAAGVFDPTPLADAHAGAGAVLLLEDVLHLVPVALLPAGGERLFHRLGPVRQVWNPVVSAMHAARDQDRGDGRDRLLSATWLAPADRVAGEGHKLANRLAELAAEFGLEDCFRDAPPLDALGEALAADAAVAVFCGHGVRAGGLAVGGNRHWSGSGLDLTRVGLLVQVSCSLGGARQDGPADVSGFCAELAASGCRAVAAARWPIDAAAGVRFAATLVAHYLRLRRQEPGRPGARAAALRRTREQLLGAGRAGELAAAAAFELYGLG